MGDQPLGKNIPAEHTYKMAYTSIRKAGYEPTIPVIDLTRTTSSNFGT
jgi:hypothetical protein